MPEGVFGKEGFNLPSGRLISSKYEIVSRLGTGWEGDVYLTRERSTGIERAAKLFFPDRNPGNRTAKNHALKLHRLRHCPILIQYVAQEVVRVRGRSVTALISEYMEGELLREMLSRRPGKRLPPFEALHLLHALASGVADLHQAREYHGDLHTENIFVRRFGLGFEVRLIDVFDHRLPKKEQIQEDVLDLIRVFYDALGGARWYRRHPLEIKAICCGLKRSLILKKFRTAGQLRDYLQRIEWD